MKLRHLGLVFVLALVAAACGSSARTAAPKNPAPTTAPHGGISPVTEDIASLTPISSAPEPGAERLHFKVGPFTVEPGQNNIANRSAHAQQPPVDGWIVGIRPNLEYANGKTPGVDVIHLHHAVWVNLSATDATASLPERFFAVGEEKSNLKLPAGYGYQYKATDRWLLDYMLHNLTPNRAQVWITYDIDFIPATSPAAKGIVPAHPVWMDVRNGEVYPVFDIPHGAGHGGEYTYPDDAPNAYPAGSTPLNQWTVPQDGVLLATAGHVHPGGLRDDMWLQRKGATALPGGAKPGTTDTAHIFSSVGHYYEPAGPVSWDVTMSATPSNWRVQVHKGDKLSINATYDSSKNAWYEGMGIMVVWWAYGTGGTDPFKTNVNVPGVLTHGHLPENDNHGGPAPDPAHYVDETKLPSRMVPNGYVIDISNFTYASGDMSIATTVPTVKQGSSLTFKNLDSPLGNGIWHTITACRLPCDGKTGIAFPLANGPIQFDSGELGTQGPPASGTDTWSTPKNLPPGTYTYFCRIHPFMRGAFRVVA